MRFEKGEVVRLKSGGPPMTIKGNALKGANTEDYYIVNWFTPDGVCHTAEFRKEQLEKN